MARKLNALILDDSGMTRKMIMKDLQATGLAEFAFTEADDGLEGLEKYNPDDTDIIFVDFQMPRKDGAEFLQDLAAKHPCVPPAVMITSERSMEVLEKAADAGVSAFLLKPVDRQRLQKGLKKLIDSLPDRSNETSAIPYGECVPQATKEILQQTCGAEVTDAPDDESIRHGETVFGSISVIGDVHWSLVLGFEKSAAVAVASKFAMFDIPADSLEMGDAVSELANMVAGQIKRLLSVREVEVEISLPVVNVATGIRTLTQRGSTCEHKHYTSEFGPMWTTLMVGMSPGLVL